ncbi:MAG TPA: hypothetical protein VH040_10150 [Usitatibacter sp.]|jgi:hypothetical protein|nr:hypothetical protein [Usitatibacter sp.]
MRRLASLLAALACFTAHADRTVVLLRHGEKPAAGLGQLSCQGLNRALALPDVLFAKFGKPTTLYAPNPGVMKKDRGVPYNYIRPLATIEPTAIRFELPVDARFGLDDLDPLESDLLQPGGGVIFVAWEHNLIPRIARDMLARRGAKANVPDWNGKDFDSLYVIILRDAGGAEFRVDREDLDGQPSRCGGAR